MLLAEGWLIIKQYDFNKDLDDYLATRRSISGEPKSRRNFSLFKRKRKSKVIREPKEEMVEEMKELEEEIKEMDEDFEDEYDVQKREGLLTRFFKLLRSNPEKYEEEMENPELDEELREVLKISFMWLNKLPPHHMKEFKASGDFETCKELLIRYGIAKEKE